MPGKLLLGTALGAAAGPTVNFQPLQTILAVLGTLGLFAGIVTAGVAIYKSRSEKNLNSTQAIAVLFDKQRELNEELLAKRDQEIDNLNRQLAHTTGNREQLERQLAKCQRDRELLRQQIRGLDATLIELRPPNHKRCENQQ